MNVLIESRRAVVMERRKRFIEVISWICLVVLLCTLFPLVPSSRSTWKVELLLISMGVFFCIGIYLNRKGMVSLAANLIILAISVLLYITALLEGRFSDASLYYFPILIAVPFFIDYRQTTQLVFHLLHPTIFVLLLTFNDGIPWLPEMTPEIQKIIHMTNSIIVIFLCQFFVYEIVTTNLVSEEQLHVSERQLRSQNEDLRRVNQNLDQFVYSISHDLRAPVASALGLVELMKDEEDPQEMQEYNQIMERNLSRLDRFISDILDYSHNSQFDIKKDAVDLRQEIEDAIQQYLFMEGAARVEVVVSAQQTSPFVTDRYRLRVILNNLISNAFRYQNPAENHPWIHITCKTAADKAFLKIRDNGVGIAREHLSQIFDMFYRANQSVQGSGLGLYIAQESAHKIGGTIRVISEEGHFTEFTIELPSQT